MGNPETCECDEWLDSCAYTYVLVARSQHNSFVDAENVSTLETVCPSTAGQVAQHRSLTVRLIRIGLCSVARIKSNLCPFK